MKKFSKASLNLSGLVCLSLLVLPVVLSPLSKDYNQNYLQVVEKRAPKPLPKLSVDDVVNDSFYKKLDGFLSDKVAFRGFLIQARKFAEIQFLQEDRFGRVDIGKHNWLYFRSSYWLPKEQTEEAARNTLHKLENFLEQADQYRADFRLVVAPDKHTIYPENLSAQGLRDVERTSAARKIFHDWFYQQQDARVINLWQALLTRKAESDELLYIPGDTHHSFAGAMVMARETVESIQPGIWRDEDVVKVGEEYSSDLSTLIGLHDIRITEDSIIDEFRVQRPGVKVEKVTLEGQEFSSLEAAEQAICIDRNRPGNCTKNSITQVISSSTGQPLIKGKTLIIHDSFIQGFLRPSLIQFFEDVSFVHHDNMTSESFHQALENYDHVILETVERSAFGVEGSWKNLYVLNKLMRPPLSDAWTDPKAKTVWRFDAQTKQQRMATGDTAQLKKTVHGLRVSAKQPSPRIAFKLGQLSSSRRYIVRLDMATPVTTEAAVTLAGGKGKIAKPALIGKNQIFFELQGSEMGDWIQISPGQSVQNYLIKSIEIRDVTDVDAAIADDQP